MKYELSTICDYRKEKVDVSLLNTTSYISTENMVSNKGGITTAVSLPSTSLTQKFCKGDVLVSNIRPYFKKIWKATFNGGCSNDVLVLSVKEGIDEDFLYYVLADDKFFEYSTATSKGTKMPRGDKSSIMKYKVSVFPIETQQKTSSVLHILDDKMDINKQINDNLFVQAQVLFDLMFPNVSEGDKTIGDYITPKRGKGLLSKDAVFGEVSVVAGGLEPATYHNASNTTAPVLTISASGANAGFVNIWQIPVWSSDSSFIDSEMTDDVYFWYVMLKKRQNELFDAQTGSAQPHIYPQHVAIMPVSELNAEAISDFTAQVKPFFTLIGENLKENIRLAAIRDALLPRLMSGELDVSVLDL